MSGVASTVIRRDETHAWKQCWLSTCSEGAKVNSGRCRIGTASLSFLTILFPGILNYPDLEDFASSGEAVTTLTHTRSSADFWFHGVDSVRKELDDSIHNIRAVHTEPPSRPCRHDLADTTPPSLSCRHYKPPPLSRSCRLTCHCRRLTATRLTDTTHCRRPVSVTYCLWTTPASVTSLQRS